MGVYTMNKKQKDELIKELNEADKHGETFCFTMREVCHVEYLVRAKNLDHAKKLLSREGLKNNPFVRGHHITNKVSEEIIKIETTEEFRKNRGIGKD